ncbi:hypothetical protein [Piscibacillus halophilus]|uniref:Uncharacterized protein n=1 Tax=Piscibacillus halophilus TaxID=571933 RepID=A0A1H9AT39_9BACI|nr:hypothetical protein [Piscibacillus halophilus]SEP79088.1 hypothetical protein SAMN05216362_10323 [Piscibacillus halophilus]
MKKFIIGSTVLISFIVILPFTGVDSTDETESSQNTEPITFEEGETEKLNAMIVDIHNEIQKFDVVEDMRIGDIKENTSAIILEINVSTTLNRENSSEMILAQEIERTIKDVLIQHDEQLPTIDTYKIFLKDKNGKNLIN